MASKYSDLTIKQFLNIQKISDSDLDTLDKSVKILHEVSGKTIDEIESLPIGEMLKKIDDLKFVEAKEPKRLKLKYKLKGKRFIVKWREQELSAAQYIDVCHFCKDSSNLIYNIHNIIAAVSVRRNIFGKEYKYNGEEHKEVADLIYNNMKISTAYPIMLFFCKYYKELRLNILTFLEEEAEKAERIGLEIAAKYLDLERNGDGLQP